VRGRDGPFQAAWRGLSCCIWGRRGAGGGGRRGGAIGSAPAERSLRLSRWTRLLRCSPGRSQRPRGGGAARRGGQLRTRHDTTRHDTTRARFSGAAPTETLGARVISYSSSTLHERALGFLLTCVAQQALGASFLAHARARGGSCGETRGRADDREGDSSWPGARVCFWPCRPRLASYAAQQSSGWAVLSLAWCGCGGDAEAKRTLRFGASAVVVGGRRWNWNERAGAFPGASGAFVRGVRDKIFGLDSALRPRQHGVLHRACGVRFLAQVLTGGARAVGCYSVFYGVQILSRNYRLQLRLYRILRRTTPT